ncbi:energy-coupling factor ABC transporter substrate-binding protein [Streptomyces sp. LP05-1]|uniref:Cobalt transport protein CbiN n=1 Tax=Streptomyces pyxinae TaxID=2970734 RepID=A0ABT2CHM6_9ACTN|nr:energy-coupling factor ABC transporter substrate-binding protein [Streptomyces sp. LP05-1]MCS0636810.1 energy-coupling factor ABC transporter substrate-binding protein [Streptomyces sp. LP05-1]
MSRNAKINTLLLLVVAALAVLPLALGLGDHKEEPFAGADAQAETAITELKPDYKPWFSPLYEPPSGEVESALFALQAALGAGVLAYYFGLRRGRRQGESRALAGAAGNGSPADDTQASGDSPADAAPAPGSVLRDDAPGRDAGDTAGRVSGPAGDRTGA